MANTPIAQLPPNELIGTVSGNLRITAFSGIIDFNNSNFINIKAANFNGGLSVANSFYTTGAITQSGDTVTGIGTTFTSALVNGLFVPASGNSAIVLSVNSPTSLTVSVSQTLGTATAYVINYGGSQIDNVGNFYSNDVNANNVNVQSTVTTDYVTLSQTGSTSVNSFSLSTVGQLYFGSNEMVQQVGSVTPGNSVTWSVNGLIQDGGPVPPTIWTIGTGTSSAKGGFGCTASGNEAITYGLNNTASGNYSVAFGTLCQATAVSAFAAGSGCIASGQFSNALGFAANAAGNYSTAIGYNASASQSGVFALSDSFGNPFSNSTANIFTATFANGYNFNINSSTKGVNINSTGTLLPQQGMATGQSTYNTGTISQTGTTVTGTGTFFTSNMTGGLLCPASGSPCLIESVNTSTSLTVSVTQSIAASTAYQIIYGGTQIDNLGNVSFNNIYSNNNITINNATTINGNATVNGTETVKALAFNSTSTLSNAFTWLSGNTFPFFGSNAVCLQSGSVSGGHLAAWNGNGILVDAGLAISLNSLTLNTTASTVTHGFAWNSSNTYPTFGSNNVCLQSGTITAGHLVSWNANGLIQDAGSTVTVNALAFNSGATIANTFTWNSSNTSPSWGSNLVCLQSGTIAAGNLATWSANGTLVDGGPIPSGGALWSSSATNNIWNSTATAIATSNTTCIGFGVSAAAGTSLGVVNAMALGSNTVASTPNSTAVGSHSHASGANSSAFGNNAFATGDYSVALGYSCTAAGIYSIAFNTSTANGDNSIAIGFNATANNKGSCVTVDSNFGTLAIASDTSTNQWVGSFQGGYNFYLSATTTPVLAVQIDTAGNLSANKALVVSGNTSLAAVNTTGLATLNSLSVTNGTTLTGNLVANGTANQIFGRTTAQTAGYVGEIISSSGSGTGLTASSTNTNIATISLTAGVWDIKGNIYLSGASGLTTIIAGFSTTSVTLPSINYQTFYLFPSSSKYGAPVPPQTITITSTTTVYLVAQAAMSGSTASSNYSMYAVRVA